MPTVLCALRTEKSRRKEVEDMTRRRILTGWAIGLLLGVMAAGTALGAESGWKTEDGVLKFVDSKGNYVTNEWRTRDGKSYFLGSD